MRKPCAMLGLAACVGLLSACARTIVEHPQPTDYDPSDTTAQLDFWHGLPGESAVSNDEAFHGVLLMFDGHDDTLSYDKRVEILKEREWLTSGFAEAGDIAMSRGTLSYILVRAMDVKGGVMMFLTSRNHRYSTLELQRLGVMPPGSELMVIDGLDYVGTMSKAQDFMVVKGMREAEEQRELEPGQAEDHDAEAVAPQPTAG